MPNFTLDYINNLLDLSNEEKLKDIAEFLAKGPDGALDSWLLLMEESKNPWLKRVSKPSIYKKKKIIFSDYTFSQYVPTNQEMQFISVLIKYYDIYLWPGNNDQFENC